jgi:hypothetical protein
MVEQKYGMNARDPLRPVNWKKVFKENRCPYCTGLLSLTGRAYICSECNLTISTELFDKASKERDAIDKLLLHEKKLLEKAKNAGLKEPEIQALRDEAEDRGYTEYMMQKRRTGSGGSLGGDME